MSKERIQKALARQGLGSRRAIEGWIKEGLIQLNGEVVELGQQVETGDVIMYSGRKIIIRDVQQTLPRVLMYHKPEGEVCTRSDPEGRATIFDHAPGLKHSRWIAVGRLDINTSGLILLTDDGDLANKLMHPSSQLQREYAVRVMGKASAEQLKKLTHGVELEDGKARFEDIVETTNEDGSPGASSSFNRWYHVVLMEGRNREVRRMWEAVDLKVSRLIRVRYGSVLMTKSNRPGRFYELDPKTIRELAVLAGIEYDASLKSGVPVKKVFRMQGRKQTTRGQGGRSRSNGGGNARSGSGSAKKPSSKRTGTSSNRQKSSHDKRR
ncbi:MAG: 23S rRNA pseudouridylate synthase B [endosymbiont of Galathealinum brachiosum]|uniref:Pseudouridine synthase n=1 Tax=endosymbiont of Galathealinum brachiosum TaxID=2200906 RepID=A0A370DJX7_9GAMM|nr:MAG: 23S rRNA pseudouridylate synthase B [endosymbiont of Galathealinum brachiosum]